MSTSPTRILTYALVILCFIPSISAQKRLLHPSNVKLIAFDRNIDGAGTHLIVFKTAVDLPIGTRLGVTNGVYSDTTKAFQGYISSDPSYAEIIYDGSESIPSNSILGIEYGFAGAPKIYRIKDQLTDISSLFTLETSSGFDFATGTQSDHVFLYQGKMEQNNASLSRINGQILGGVSLNDKTLDIPDNIETTFQEPGPNVPDAGIIKCEDAGFVCETVGGQLPDLWDAIVPTSGNDLIPTITEYFNCPEGICDSTTIDYCPVKCIDIAFLLDCSGSVSPSEYDDMVASIQGTMQELENSDHDIRYSVYKFSSSSQFELTTPFTNNVGVAQNIGPRPFTGGTAVSHAVNNVRISHGSNNPLRQDVDYIFMLYTDAVTTGERQPYFDIRSAPYNALFHTIRYMGVGDNSFSNSSFSTVSSVGGTYRGSIFYDNDDPDGAGIRPRHLLATRNFSDPFPGLSELVLECPKANAVYIELNHPECDDPDIVWSTQNGSFIDATPTDRFEEISLSGTYTVSVTCSNTLFGCDQRDTITVESIEPLCEQNQSMAIFGGADQGDLHFNDRFGKGEVAMSLFPNPGNGTVNISFSIPEEVIAQRLNIINNNSQVIRSFDLNFNKGDQNITLNALIPGIYYAELVTSSEVKVVDFVVIQ